MAGEHSGGTSATKNADKYCCQLFNKFGRLINCAFAIYGLSRVIKQITNQQRHQKKLFDKHIFTSTSSFIQIPC